MLSTTRIQVIGNTLTPASRGRPATGTILVVVNSTPIRSFLVAELKRLGFNVSNAVNIADAVHYMSTKGVPASFIIASELGLHCGDGIALVQRLSQLDKTQHLPTIVVLNTPTAMEAFQQVPLPEHVVPVIIHSSLLAFTRAVVRAHEEATDAAPAGCATSRADDEGPSIGEAYGDSASTAALDKAFELFTAVVERVKQDQLPGPMMPQLLQQVRQLFADPDVEFKTVSKFTIKHPVLSGRLLAMANSAYYMRGKRSITDVLQAIGRIGLQATSSLLLAIAARNYIVGKDPTLKAMIKQELEKAYFVGVVGEMLARKTRTAVPSEVYMLGLFHNVGATFLMYTFALLHDKNEVERVDCAAIKTMTLNKATALNELVCEAMNLPDELILLYASEPVTEPSPAVRLIQQAIWIADRVLDQKQERLDLDPEAELLGIDHAMVDALNDHMDALLGLLTAYRS